MTLIILTLNDLNLIPEIKWFEEMEKLWEPGEAGAQKNYMIF
ncbi:MAG: hypothetical protein CM15mP109_08500 [Candidatus Dadabacteria bacterium]|nr:MAG: hypothetical protein CM15mP109_08500 [Candidatus Dadabacteria bacterium]